MVRHGRRVLLTGGAGFMGSAVAHALVRAGHTVRVLDLLTYAGDRANLAGLSVDFVQGDVADAGLVAPLVGAADLVIHMAAETHVARSLEDAGPFLRTNVEGTRVVLEACARVRVPLVHVSTDEVFGPAARGVSFRTDAPFRPTNPYAASKAAAEHLVAAWRSSMGFSARVVRCVNNFGPRQHEEKAIPGWIARGRRGEALPLHGRGEAVRDWLHVADFASAMARIAAYEGPRQVFHLAGRQERTNREVASFLAERLGVGIVEVPDRPGQDARYALDDAGTRADLDWTPRVGLEEGLETLLAAS